jgi:hypothetical protein
LDTQALAKGASLSREERLKSRKYRQIDTGLHTRLSSLPRLGADGLAQRYRRMTVGGPTVLAELSLGSPALDQMRPAGRRNFCGILGDRRPSHG